MWFDDLVIIAKVSHPIPFRTRPLNPFALMVLRLKARESKSSPDLLTILIVAQKSLPCLCLLMKNAVIHLLSQHFFCLKTRIIAHLEQKSKNNRLGHVGLSTLTRRFFYYYSICTILRVFLYNKRKSNSCELLF